MHCSSWKGSPVVGMKIKHYFGTQIQENKEKGDARSETSSSKPERDVKPCGIPASYKLELLAAVQGLVWFLPHWWQMVRAILKSLFPACNSNCMKTSALGQHHYLYFGKKAEEALQLNNFPILTIKKNESNVLLLIGNMQKIGYGCIS